MLTLAEKKEIMRIGRDRLRQGLSHHSFEDVERLSNAMTADPLRCLEIEPKMLPIFQLCIGITLGELLIEREEEKE